MSLLLHHNGYARFQLLLEFVDLLGDAAVVVQNSLSFLPIVGLDLLAFLQKCIDIPNKHVRLVYVFVVCGWLLGGAEATAYSQSAARGGACQTRESFHLKPLARQQNGTLLAIEQIDLLTHNFEFGCFIGMVATEFLFL